MTGLALVANAIVAAGMVGYVVCLVMLWRFRAWMGDRGQGWPRILLTTLIALVALLAILYLASLYFMVAAEPRMVRLVWSFANAIALAILPWALAVALWRWWPRGGRMPPRPGGIPNGTGDGDA
jgi:hypothetical protein